MPGKDPISQLGDLAALQANAEKIIDIVSTIKEAIKSVPDIALAYKNSSGGAEVKKSTEDLIKANNDLLNSQKALDVERAKTLSLEGEIAKQIAVQRELNKQKASDMRNEARDAAGLNDAYKKLTLQYQEAARAAKNLASTPGSDPQALAKANAIAKGLSDQLKAIDAAVGQNQRSVGNYIGAIQVLDKSLGEGRAQLNQFAQVMAQNAARSEILQERMVAMAQAGQENSKVWLQMKAELEGINKAQAQLTNQTESLTRQETLLTALTSQQAKGFMSVTMEIRSVEKALISMQAAGMEGTEAFEQLQLKLAQAQRKMHDFKEEQTLLKNDVPQLAALTTVAKGLGGAYAIAAGGAALLANGDEKVEKELNKLVAIMTILQGLNEVHELLEKKGAVATIANATAQGFKNFIMTGSVKTQAAKNVAQIDGTAIEEANTIATETNIAAEMEQVAANEAVAVSSAGASAGLIGLRIALIGTGIGALLVLLPAVANAMGLFKKETLEEAKAAAELQGVITDLNEGILKFIELQNSYERDTKRSLQDQLEYAQKAGKNFYEQFAIKQKIADVDKAIAEHNLQQATHSQTTDEALRKVTDTIEGQGGKLAGQQDILNSYRDDYLARAGKMDKSDRDSALKRIDDQQKLVDALRKNYEASLKLLNDYDDADKTQKANIIERDKFTADEQRELAKAVAVTRAQAVIDSNAIILASEKSTQQQRLTAESSNLVQQLRIIRAERDARLNAPGVTPVQTKQIKLESGAQETKVREDALSKIQKINDDYRKREQAAEYEIMRTSIEAQAKGFEDIANDEKVSLNKRLAAFDAYEQRQRVLINAAADFARQKAGLTAKELFAIEVKRQAQLTELAAQTQVKQAQLILSSLELQQKRLEGGAQIAGLREQINGYQQLIDKFKAGQISAEAFARAKDKIANSTAQIALQQQLVTLQFIQGEYKRYGQDTTDIDKQIAATRLALLDKETASILKQSEMKKQLRQDELALVKQGENLIAAFVEGTIEREINALQEQIDQNNKLKETETARITNSTLSESQKAATLIELNAKTDAQNEALQRKQRDLKLKEAEFDRDKTIADITGSTAAAVAKDIGIATTLAADPLTAPLAANAFVQAEIAGASGLAQIAFVLAKPLPKFAKGTASSPEGLAITDEYGPELYRTPGGKVFKGSDLGPTLRYLEKGTEIIPHGEYGGPEVEIISYDRLKSWQTFDVSSSHTYENRRLEKKIDELKGSIEAVGQQQVDAMKRYRAVIPPSNDPGPEFWAHIYNSCK